MSDILVVDDVALLRDAIAGALRREGFDALCADNGRMALRLAHKFRPRLILLDISMPEMDGMACLQALRNDDETREIPVIMLTDVADRDMVVRAAHLGIRGYLRKSSFSLDDMLAKVREVIGHPHSFAQPRAYGPPVEISSAAKLRPSYADSYGPASRSVTAEPVATAPMPGAHAAPPRPTAAFGGAAVTAPVPVPVRSDFGDAALTSTAVLDRILRHQRLQAIPPVLHHVLSLTHSSTSSIKEIADAVRNDPALAVTVMKIANSSFYAGGKRVQTLPDAAQRVGISSIANTITAVLAFEHFSTSSGAGLVPQHFWEHSLATAVLSEQIAKTASADNAEHLFLAGLLHDIGRIMLCEAFPAEYAKVLARSAEVGVDVVEVEPRMFGLTHADVTREILRHLKLPNAVIDAAWQHELPIGRLNGQQRRSALIVAAGNRMAHALAFGDSGNTMLLDLAEYAEPLDLSLEKMKVIAAESEKVMEDRKLFYASQSDEAFCTSLTADLSKIGGAVRTAVLPATQFAAGLALFCHQMKWLDERKPRVAVLVVRSEQEAKRCGTALAEIDEKLGRKAGVLLASPNGQIQAPAELREGRTWGTAAYPGRYAPFAEALARVTAESEPTAG